ncbi:MAG: BadF/BadG/BcrA/BcrD ATPase family protein [Pseudomonadota bacterium]
MRSEQYVFAVDGGGSGCRVRLCDAAGHVCAEAVGGPANVFTDTGAALTNILATIDRAAEIGGLRKSDIAAATAHLGVAGVVGTKQSGLISEAMPFADLTISDDRHTSVVGAFGTDDGVLVAVGTGSFVAAKSADNLRYIGGWGHRLSDQASGFWLGENILRRTVLAVDGLATHSDLTQHVLAEYGGTPAALADFAQTAPPNDIAALAPLVIDAADTGDANGMDLMQDGAAYLMACIRAACWTEQTALCLTGGIGPAYADYLDATLRTAIVPARGSALDGAMQLALSRAADRSPTS